jgi:ribose transport system ATP-binding protein
MAEQQSLLRVENVSKAFPGVQALSDVSLEAHSGELVALVGENGAGKSTLIQVLSGVHRPDTGQVFLNGTAVHFQSTHEAEVAGISVVYQELSLVPNLTVAENVYADRQPTGFAGLIDTGAMRRQTQKLLDLFGVEFDPDTQVGRLSMGNQQMVEIIKALSREAKVLVLDEPTSSLTIQESERLFDRLRQLKQQGMAILYVSHHLEEVFSLSDRIVVLRDGKMVGTVKTSESDEHKIVSLMVGRELTDLAAPQASGERGVELLRLENFSRKGVFANISFQLCKGEILTFFGLVGAGRTEMARALVGLDRPSGGTIVLNGKPVHIQDPGVAMRAGMAYLSENRKTEGLFLSKSISENFLAPNLRQVTPGGWLSWNRLNQLVERYVKQLEVKTPSLRQELRNLSGGNQQKVFLGEWLATQPEVLIVDEPTRGIDVGTKQEIHRLLIELAREGKAVMVISSDLPEVLRVSSRIAIMRQGRLVKILDRAEATQEKIMAYAAGVTQKE